MPSYLKDKLYDVEHALSMYAYSFVHFPANFIYDELSLSQFEKTIKSCHIYLIGLLPVVSFVDARQEDRQLITTLSLLGSSHDIAWPLDNGLNLYHEDEHHYVADQKGNRSFPAIESMMIRLNQKTQKVNFDVKYIGQAYGKDGSRNALDRLMKHETLQKIALQGIPDGYRLELLLLEIQPSNKIFTVFNPNASNKNQGNERINAGLDKLFDTNEQERITLYEASLIRYFMPVFNKEFKNSFPSTNMKVLKDCYDKDFSAIIAEICFDELPYFLYSDVIEPDQYHIITHDLHDNDARKVFFS